jgi:pimeloyl-ACP methyl ester carboxylesterase
MKPFEVTWSREAITALRDKIGRYRFPAAPADAGWRYGCDPEFLRQLCVFWQHDFDFEGAAARLNRFPQWMVQIDGLDLHALHVVGEARGRRPLLLTHGWPGSVYEFWQVIEPLAFPSRFGGRAEDAFDLVIPSLPGYGFSGKPAAPTSARTTARLFHQLMLAFGYSSYHAQGGDWGSAVSAWLGLQYPEAVKGIHLNYLLVQPDAVPDTEEEKAWKVAFDAKQAALGAYAMLHNTRPHSLSYAMVDNPVAQAAWIVERFHDWGDLSERSFEDVFDKTRLLTNVMIYVLNDAFNSSTWFYAGAIEEAARTMPAGRRVEVPTAFTCYPDPRIAAPPRSWVERGYHLTRWASQPRGGHFAAMEVPELFIKDITAWAGSSPTS